MKYFVITLKNRKDRQQKMLNYYNNINLNFFIGENIDNIIKYKKQITTEFGNSYCPNSVVGCASSHILLWQHIYYNFSDSDICLILEDDTYIDIGKLNSLQNSIKSLIKQKPHSIIKIVGEKLIKLDQIITDSIVYNNYLINFFMGAYIINAQTCGLLYKYFQKHKISYHIDFSLNFVLSDLKINCYLLSQNIGTQLGQNDSNMNQQKYKVLNNTDEYFNYSLTLPIISLNNVNINFFTIIVYLLVILFCFVFPNPFMFIILTILIIDNYK